MTTATLSATAFRTAWEHLDLGAMPYVLHVQDEPAPWDHLADQGLARGGELDPWLGAVFKLIAHPPRSADLRLGLGTTAVRALAAPTGSGSVLAVLTRDVLTVREVAADLADALIGLLPELPGGRVGGPDLSGRAADVVDFHGPTDPAGLRAGIAGLLSGFPG
ncbi:ESX secretion-associated protein EspG [Saccharothrix sp. HUAS TT10]|uniref:ESX secretion-associated protein EspG n=1 Tax=Saccharothrix sp. HUAS TT10 TaxID=3447450 RepID=UPI003F7127C1